MLYSVFIHIFAVVYDTENSIEKNGCFGTYPIFMRVQSQWGMRRQKNTRIA